MIAFVDVMHMMSLEDELELFTQNVISRRGEAEAAELFAGQIGVARIAGVNGHGIKVGDCSPDFVLPNALGQSVSLHQLLTGPLVLVFYRGSWCPYCNIQLRAYQRVLAEIRGLGGDLAALSPETPDLALSNQEKEGLEFQVLSDTDGQVSKAFGLVFTVSDRARELLLKSAIDVAQRNGNGAWELPVPAVFVIGVDRTILFADVDVDYRRRTEPQQILDVLSRCQTSRLATRTPE